MKFFIKIETANGVVYLAPEDIIGRIARWYRPEHYLVLKALALEEIPLILLPLSPAPYYFDSRERAQDALAQASRQLKMVQAWAKSGESDLFSYVGAHSFHDLSGPELPATIESLDIPEGYQQEALGEPRWHVATHYDDQGYFFLQEGNLAAPKWIKESMEGQAWSAGTEEEALKKAKMITRTESVYAYPRFCVFS